MDEKVPFYPIISDAAYTYILWKAINNFRIYSAIYKLLLASFVYTWQKCFHLFAPSKYET